jgi:hypothetical protein
MIPYFSGPTSSPAMEAFRARQKSPNQWMTEGYQEPIRQVSAPQSSVKAPDGRPEYSSSFKAAAMRMLSQPRKGTIKEHDDYSSAAMITAYAHIMRKKDGTLPGTKEGASAVLMEDVNNAIDEVETKAYRSQNYSKKFPGVEKLTDDDLLRDASKRLVGSKTSVDIYKTMTPGQGGKSFSQLCRDIYINRSGLTPKMKDEKGFVNLHVGYSVEPIGYDSVNSKNNDDGVFNSSTKIYNRGDNRHGYDNNRSDTDAEYVADRTRYHADVATGERDDIYENVDEEFLAELHAKLTYDILPDGNYDEEEFLEASDLAFNIVEDWLDDDEDEDREHYNGRKLRHDLTKKERDALQRFGSLNYKSAGAKRKYNKETVKEGADEDRENSLLRFTNSSWQRWCESLRQQTAGMYSTNKFWTDAQFKYNEE